MQNKLRQLQLTQLEILREIDIVCKNNGLKYSLYAGTLLGAVRHKGFIPWDDDLDICMLRKDYDRFIEVWENGEHPGYVIQNKENTPEFTQSFTKIRKDHTTFWQEGEKNDQYHLGVFVDIFPIDRLPKGMFRKRLYQYICIIYQIYTREYMPLYGNRIEKLIAKFFLSVIPKEKREKARKSLLKKITKWNLNDEMHMVDISTIETLKITLPPQLLNEYTELEFCGSKFACISLWDEYLKLTYGNYMEMPPEEERVWKHHPLVLDFEHNYEELKNE